MGFVQGAIICLLRIWPGRDWESGVRGRGGVGGVGGVGEGQATCVDLVVLLLFSCLFFV